MAEFKASLVRKDNTEITVAQATESSDAIALAAKYVEFLLFVKNNQAAKRVIVRDVTNAASPVTVAVLQIPTATTLWTP